MKAKIFVVDDETQIRKFLRISLEAHGFTVIESRLGSDALERCGAELPDLVILDLGLPDLDGHEVIRRLREWSTTPIIVLSVRDDEREKVAALDAGANDYVTKPFTIGELMARVRVLLRSRTEPAADHARFRCGELEVDLSRRRVQAAGRLVELSKKEYAVLRCLVLQAGGVVTHRQLLREVWGPAHVEDTHYLRVLIGHLRQKIGDDPSRTRYIHTVQGVGYRLSDV